MKETRLTVVRHGSTLFNEMHRLQGSINMPLSEKGQKAAAELARQLIGSEVSAIYTSPLVRAAQTAQIIGAHLNLLPITEGDLRERSVGGFQGYSIDYLPSDYRKLPLDIFFAQARIAGCEEPWGFRTRTYAIMAEIANRQRGQNSLVVTHGGNIRAFLYAINASDHFPNPIPNNTPLIFKATKSKITFVRTA